MYKRQTGNIIIGENTQSVVKTGYDAVIGNNLTVKGSIITDVNENKNIFTDVTWNGAQSYNIQIGGLKKTYILTILGVIVCVSAVAMIFMSLFGIINELFKK